MQRLLLEKFRVYKRCGAIHHRSPLLNLLQDTLEILYRIKSETEKSTTRVQEPVEDTLIKTTVTLLGCSQTIEWLKAKCGPSCDQVEQSSCQKCSRLTSGLDAYGIALHVAAYVGDLVTLTSLLDHHADIDACNAYFVPPLEVALVQRDKSVVELLLSNEAAVSVQIPGQLEWAALRTVAANGDEVLMRVLLERASIDVDSQAGGNDCCTALHLSARAGHDRCVQVLLEHAADIELLNEQGNTALHLAAGGGHTSVVATLLKNCAIASEPSDKDENALHLAAVGGHTEVVELLLEKERGLDVNAVCGRLGSALHAAAAGGHDEMVRILLRHGADISLSGGVQIGAALHYAAFRGHASTIRLLLERGADMFALDEGGQSVLAIATWADHPAAVKVLLECGADPNREDDHGTPLDLAVQRQKKEMLDLLLSHGGDANAKIYDGHSLLTFMTNRAHHDMVRLILEKGADVEYQHPHTGSALHQATRRSNLVMARDLLDYGANVDARNSMGDTPLMGAAYEGHFEMVRFLLGNGADVHARAENAAVAIAASKGHGAVVRTMLEHGAAGPGHELDFVEALSLAKMGGKKGVMQLLLRKSGHEDAPGGNFYQVLLTAVLGRYDAVVLLLLSQQATLWPEDASGLQVTPLYAAVSAGNRRIVEMLLDQMYYVSATWRPSTASLCREDIDKALRLAQSNKEPAIERLIEQGAKRIQRRKGKSESANISNGTAQ